MDTFTGTYGIVALPDSYTQRFILDLAQQVAPTEFITEIAHLTLYHGKLAHAPVEDVRMILDATRILVDRDIVFERINVFGEKFAFLDVLRMRELRLAHLAALHLSQYLDRSAIPKARDEGLVMNDEELRNVERYGHPLTYHLVRPHFTLAYSSTGFERIPQLPEQRRDAPFIRSVVFAEIGAFGAVTQIINI